jgi:hypothetical protein
MRRSGSRQEGELSLKKHSIAGVRSLGLAAIAAAAFVAAMLSSTSTVSAAAPCSQGAAHFTLPNSAWTCDGQTLIATGQSAGMALSTNAYGNPEVTVDVMTNAKALVGLGMSDASNGHIVSFVPTGGGSSTGVALWRRSGGVDTLLGSVSPAGLPTIYDTTWLVVKVSGSTVSVWLNGSPVATFNAPWLVDGKVGLGLIGSASNSRAEFTSILLGGTVSPVHVGAANVCYDVYGHEVSCACFDGFGKYTCGCDGGYGMYYDKCGCFDGYGKYTCGCDGYDKCGGCHDGYGYDQCGCHDGYGYGYDKCGGCHDGYGYDKYACQCYAVYGKYSDACKCLGGYGYGDFCKCAMYQYGSPCGCPDGHGMGFDGYGKYGKKYYPYFYSSDDEYPWPCKVYEPPVCDGDWVPTPEGLVLKCY